MCFVLGVPSAMQLGGLPGSKLRLYTADLSFRQELSNPPIPPVLLNTIFSAGMGASDEFSRPSLRSVLE